MSETLGTSPSAPGSPKGPEEPITEETGPKKPRKRSSRLSVQHGSASMKAYPVTSIELWGLGSLGLLASLAFSAGASCITFSIDTTENLDLSQGVASATLAYWQAAKLFAMIGGIGLLVVSIATVAGGSLYILHILRRTTFDE